MHTHQRDTHQPQRYPTRINISTPTGTKSVEWKALCLQLEVSKAKALLQSWEKANDPKDPRPMVNDKAGNHQKGGLGVFVHSKAYRCMDYWEVTSITYRDSLVSHRAKPVEATWSVVKKALLYKLF